jgi:prepilin-type N-terminal cleavage/methylation domain-containing protein
MLSMKNAKGFTLVEMIVVVTIIAVLVSIVFVAIDPARRLNESRNARRASDVATILDAVKTYQADHDGVHFEEITDMDEDTYYVIGDSGGLCNTCTAVSDDVEECIDFTDFPANYLANVPFDPVTGSAGDSDYYIMRGSDGTITLGACEPQGEGPGGDDSVPEIEVSR